MKRAVRFRTALFGLGAEDLLEIFLGGGNRSDVVILNQKVKHVRGNESRQAWPDLDVLDAEMQ